MESPCLDLEEVVLEMQVDIWRKPRKSMNINMRSAPEAFRILWRPDEKRVYLFGEGCRPVVIPESACASMIPLEPEIFERWFTEGIAAPKKPGWPKGKSRGKKSEDAGD